MYQAHFKLYNDTKNATSQKCGVRLVFACTVTVTYIATSWVCRMLYICHVTAGKTIPPPRPSEPNPDYVQCPHCERRFEEYAAERHIPFCKEKHARIERKAQDKAMDKLNKRIQVYYIVSV